MWPALIMAAMGAAQYKSQQDKEGRDRKLAAQTQLYSPWTGLQAGGVKEADLYGTLGQGAVQGLAMEQQMDKAKNDKNLQEAQMKYYNRVDNPQAPPPPGGGGDPGATAFNSPSLEDSYGKFGTNGAMMSQDPRLQNMNAWQLMQLQKQQQYAGR